MLHGNSNYLFSFASAVFPPSLHTLKTQSESLNLTDCDSDCTRFSSTLPPPPYSNTSTPFFIEKDRRQLAPVFFSMCFDCSTTFNRVIVTATVSTLMVFPTYWSGKRGVERWERKQLGLSAMFVATFWFYGNGFSEGLILLSCYQFVHFDFLLFY